MANDLQPDPTYDNQYLAQRGQQADDALMRQFMEETAPEAAKSPQPATQTAEAPITAKPAPNVAPAGTEAPTPLQQTALDIAKKSAATGEPPGLLDKFKLGMQLAGTPAERAIMGGVLDAVRGTATLVDSLAEKLGSITGIDEKRSKAKMADVIPDVGPSHGVAEDIARNVVRFTSGFLLTKKAVGAAGITGKITQPLAGGALADLLVWQGDEQRLSDLIQSVPVLQNPVTEYLASNENDSKLKGKFKTALEGAGLGLIVETLFSGLRVFKQKKAAAAIVQDAAEKTPEAAVKAVQQLGPDELLRPVTEAEITKRLGDPNAPLVQRVAKKLAGKSVDEFGADVSNVFATMRRAESKAAEAGADVVTGLAKGAKAESDNIFINLSRINAPEDVQAALKATAEMDAPYINALRGGEKQTFAQMSQLADATGLTVTELVARRGKPLTLGETIAARRLWTASGEKLVELAKAAQSGTPEDIYAFRKAMTVHYAVQAEVVAERTAQARALTSWRIAAQGGRERMRAIQSLIDQSGGADLSMEMARKIALLDTPEGVSLFVRQAQHATTRDVLQEYFITGLLWSPKTHVVNTTSNSLTAIWAVPERLTAGMLSQTLGDGDIAVREGLALGWGEMKGMRDGLRMFWKAMKTGQPTGTIKAELPHVPAISAEGLQLKGSAGHVADFLGNVQRGGSRLLMAADEFFKAVAYRGELHAQAFRTARAEGLAGREMAARMADIIGNPPENLRMAAAQFADVQTFTNELGDVGKAVSRGVNKVPGLRFIVPFMRTPTNIFKYGFQRTPLAPFLGSVKADIAAGGVRADLARAKVALGTAAMLTVADMVTEGTITGQGPTDPVLRQARLRQNIPNYGVKIGDTWYQYNRLDPLAFMVGMSADATELLMHIDEEDGGQIVMAGALAFAKNMTNKTYMQGLSNLVDIIDDPQRYGDQFIANLAGGFLPLSALTRNVATANDTVRRETKTAIGDPDVEKFRDLVPDPLAVSAQHIVNEIRARTPGFGENLPPKRDLWGEPIDVTSNRGMAFDFISPVPARQEKPDAIDQMMLDNKIAVSLPGRALDGVRLTNEEYSRYVELSGKAAKERLDQIYASGGFDQLSDGPDGMKASLLKKIVLNARETAGAMMMAENLDLRERIIERSQTRANILQSGGAMPR